MHDRVLFFMQSLIEDIIDLNHVSPEKANFLLGEALADPKMIESIREFARKTLQKEETKSQKAHRLFSWHEKLMEGTKHDAK